MKRSFVLAFLFELSCAWVGSSQAPASISAELTRIYTAVKINILKTAEKMPDDSYGFKPTPEILSFAEILDEVADSQMRTCAAVAGDVRTPSAAGKTTKTEVTAALSDAFAECDKAYGSLSDANAADTVATVAGQRSKLGALAGDLADTSEQFGILSMYLRLKGFVPPTSNRPSPK